MFFLCNYLCKHKISCSVLLFILTSKNRLYFTSSLTGLINKKIYTGMCLPSWASQQQPSVWTFLLHFKAPRKLMSYPRIMKGETLLGFEIGAERVSSSHLSLFPLSSSSVQGTSQHFHPGRSSTGLRISRRFDWTGWLLFLFISHAEKPLIVPFWPSESRQEQIPLFPLRWDVLQMQSRRDYFCSSSSLTTVHHGFSHLLACWISSLKLSHTFSLLKLFSRQMWHSSLF